MLALHNVHISRPDFKAVYDAQFRAGKLICIQGPSGAGKSTLLATILGELPVQAGEIRFQEQDLTPHKIQSRPVSILLQGENLFPHLTVRENLALVTSDPARIEEVLEEVDLRTKIEVKPDALSGGQKQRVGIARFLLQDQPICLFDEPFTGLDLESAQIAARLIAGLVRDGRVVILTSHQLTALQGIAYEHIDLMDIVTYI